MMAVCFIFRSSGALRLITSTMMTAMKVPTKQMSAKDGTIMEIVSKVVPLGLAV